MLEVFSKFETYHERTLELKKAKNGVIDEGLVKKYPEVSELA